MEVFAGNRQRLLTTLEETSSTPWKPATARRKRVWALDRGMVSQDNLDFLKAGGRQYIVGTPKSQLRRFEQQLAAHDWRTIREGLEAKLCPCPDGELPRPTSYVVAKRSPEKEQAMHARFERRIEEGLAKIATSRGPASPGGGTDRAPYAWDACWDRNRRGPRACSRCRFVPTPARRRAGDLAEGRKVAGVGPTQRRLVRAADQRDRLERRRSVAGVHPVDRGRGSARIQKSDLSLRPVWHQKEDRVLAHILVCFLAYVLWTFLGQLCQKAGLGNEPRRVLEEMSELRAIDVVMPTRDGQEIRTRCVTQPNDHQKILLQRLGWELPGRLHSTDL